MFIDFLHEHIGIVTRLSLLAEEIESAGRRLADAVAAHGKVLICGNGGSAADAQHFAAELVGRFERERRPWPAIALTTDTSILTAVGNDYGFAEVFSRQVQALGHAGDVFIGVSTSGNSENVLRAVDVARGQGLTTLGLLGGDGGRLKDAVECAIVVEGSRTAHIQEVHILILHFWAGMMEARLSKGANTPETI